MSKLNIKGMRNRLIIDIDDYEDFTKAYNDLSERLRQSSDFYRDSQMKAVVKGKRLDQNQIDMMRELLEIRYGFKTLFLNPMEQKSDESVRYIKGIVRSGQVVKAPGHIVVLGDVNESSEIKAGRNIVIMGRTNGLMHAGYPDKNDAFIAAFRMESLQIRIGNVISRASDRKRYHADVPEIAYVKDGKIVIEPINQKSKML